MQKSSDKDMGTSNICQITIMWKYRNSREAVSSRVLYHVFILLLKFKLIWLQIRMTAKLTYMQQASHYTILIFTQKIFKWFQYFSFNLHLGKYFSEFKKKIYLESFFSFPKFYSYYRTLQWRSSTVFSWF